jgi:hypothetical protein
MAQERYFVIFHDGQWKIRHKRRAYQTQAEGVKAAIDAANKVGDQGHEAQVLVHGDDLLFHATWTHGQDSYPSLDRV